MDPSGIAILDRIVRDGGRPQVLVVENDPVFATDLAAAFERAGFAVNAAANGLDAVYELERTVPNVVVLDLDLPVVSGTRLLQLLRQDTDTADLPIVALTGLSFQEAPEVFRLGVDAVVELPAPAAAVVDQAADVLARVAAKR
jgi:CheY-like chemotaxis protein